MSSSLQSSDFLRGRKVCATGRFLALTHAELASLVTSSGGTFLARPKRCGFLLVIGDDGWPAEIDGAPTRVFRYASRLKAIGYNIEMLAEEEFFARLAPPNDDDEDRARGLFTISDLSRILKVSGARLRRWLAAGLIVPALTQHRLAYFDFHQVANARRLCELVNAGTSVAAMRRGLEQLRRWLPEEKLPLDQLARLEHDGRLLLRLERGLVDACGQRHFDFDANGDGQATVALPTAEPGESVDELFDAALAAEDAGHLREAASIYERAIKLQPDDPVLHFNLGNVRYGLRDFAGAADAYRASLAIDPDYAEAWNNLGNAQAQCGERTAAIASLQRALQLVPDYAAAHGSLADVLAASGRQSEAAEERARFRRLSAPSPQERQAPWLRVVSGE